MDVTLQLFVTVAGSVTTAAAVGTAKYARGAFVEARASHRILTGEDEVQSDDGLVGRVDELEHGVDEVEEQLEELEQEIPADVLPDGGRRE